MESTTMEINCWELKNGKEIPEPSTKTLNGFEWNARFRMTVSNDDGSLGLPFIFAADDTAILTVEKSEQEGKRTGNKKIKQVISCVPRSLGTEIVCSRTRSYDGNEHVWSAWEITSANSGVYVEWDMNADINTYVTAGIFNITGERLSAADGLPIENSAPGHTIHARLTVLDSSITGSGDNDDKCITQILALSNRTGGDGDVYIRTGRASMKNMLAGGSGWEPWGKLQQNVQVGQVTSLDGFTGNGMYSGVYTDGTLFETFVMVVINNYAVAGATGNVRCISQFKYALNVNSNFSYKARTGRGGSTVEWGSWVDLGAATTTDIQDNSITVQKLSTALQEQINQNTANATKAANGAYWTSGPNAVTLNINKNNGTVGWQTLPAATTEKAGVMTAEDRKEQVKKTPLLNGDTIVGLAREVYSRQGKVDTATFLKRTTAGGTSVSDGVATLKQIGGNIVKNIIGDIQNVQSGISVTDLGHGLYKAEGNGVALTQTTAAVIFNTSDCVAGHKYYMYNILCSNASNVNSYLCGVADANDFTLSYIPLQNNYQFVSAVVMINKIYVPKMFHYYPLGYRQSTAGNEVAVFSKPAVIDLTEMFGAGNEPTKEESDRMFASMGALPQGLTIAQPTGLKSTGFNQWNPENVLINKTITDNAIVDGDRNIAVIECLPCKTGTGENNGYVIGYGEGDTWSDEGIEVYLTPLNPMEVDGELYLQKLDKDATYGTYVPQIKGYLLVVTPTTDKLCAHFHWSGDRAATDYEPYVDSVVTLPEIPQMSEWGLAGIQASGTMAQDTIDLENNTYTKRIARISLSSFSKIENAVTARVWRAYTGSDGTTLYRHSVSSSASHLYYTPEERNKILNGTWSNNDIFIANNGVQYTYDESKNVTHYVAQFAYPDFAPYVASIYKVPNVISDMFIANNMSTVDGGTVVPSVGCLSGRLYISSPALKYKDETALRSLLNNSLLYYELATPEEYPIVTKAAPNYIGSDYGVEEFTDCMVPLVANIMFYMRSLVSETRNFIDRLMAGLGTSDATAVADRIVAAILPSQAIEPVTE